MRARRSRSLRICWIFAWLAASAASAAFAGATFTITEVADGVYAALQPKAQRFNDSNSAILVNEDDVIVVDTQANPASVRELIAEIKKLTDKPVSTVINTHWHSDHTQGNELYVEAFPDVEIIGHATLAEDVPGRAAPYLEERIGRFETGIAGLEKALDTGKNDDGAPLTDEEKAALPGRIERNREYYEALKEIDFVVPTRTVDDMLVLERGERRIEIYAFKAHTRGDLVIYLPKEKVLITGDVLDDLPYAGHGYPRSWISALDALSLLDFEQVIPGHGMVQKGKHQRTRVREMLSDAVTQVRTGLMGKKTLEEIRAAVDLSRARQDLAGSDETAQKVFDAWLPELIERTYLEARGQLE